MHTHMAMAVIEQIIFLPCHCYYCLQREQEKRHKVANMKGFVCANMLTILPEGVVVHLG